MFNGLFRALNWNVNPKKKKKEKLVLSFTEGKTLEEG